MIRKSVWMVALTAAAILFSGCTKSDDEFAPAFVPKTYAFDGNIEPKYVGSWQSSDGASTMQIVKDGSLNIETTARSIAGKSVTSVSGKWLASGDTLKFRYVVGKQEPTVLKYTASLSGNTLTLKLADGKAKTVYSRK
jgi:hypothetical protein